MRNALIVGLAVLLGIAAVGCGSGKRKAAEQPAQLTTTHPDQSTQRTGKSKAQPSKSKPQPSKRSSASGAQRPKIRINPKTHFPEAAAPDEKTGAAWCKQAQKGAYGAVLRGAHQVNFLVDKSKGRNVICGLP